MHLKENNAITMFFNVTFCLHIDSEDDMITMSSEEEFQEALKNISDGLLRIFIKRVDGKILEIFFKFTFYLSCRFFFFVLVENCKIPN